VKIFGADFLLAGYLSAPVYPINSAEALMATESTKTNREKSRVLFS